MVSSASDEVRTSSRARRLLRAQLRVQHQLDEAKHRVHRVRISWLMLARNALRAGPRRSARSRAARIASFRRLAIADVLVQRHERAVGGGLHRGRREANLNRRPSLRYTLDFHPYDLATPDARLQIARLGAQPLRHDQPVDARADDLGPEYPNRASNAAFTLRTERWSSARR